MKRMNGIILIGLMLLYVGVVWAQANSSNPQAAASGLYYLANGSTAVPTPFPTNVTGFTQRIRWSAVETGDGSYNWTSVDNTFATLPAGKKLALDILTGQNAPNWALNKYEADGVGTFTSVWWRTGYSGGTQNTAKLGNHAIVPCAAYEMPIPWDPTYQADLSKFVAALAAHVATLPNSAALVRIWANPMTSDTGDEEQLMSRTALGSISCDTNTPYANNSFCPYSSGTPLTSCNPPLDTPAWQAIGYTPAKVEAAWKVMFPYYTTAFPQIVVSSAFVAGNFPPIDNSGNITGSSDDTSLKFNLLSDFCNSPGYTAAQNNAASWPMPAVPVFNAPCVLGCIAGEQMGGDNTPSYQSIMNWVVQNHISYFEVYPNDITNPLYVNINGFGDTSMKTPAIVFGE
jgi:hypothetical protein